MRVVLIDDHALFREGLNGLLNRRGIEVVSCSNAMEGLSRVEESRPDVVLLDLRMPEIDGLKTLKLIRKRDDELPVIILTTSAETEDLSACLQSNANGYLLKDMDPDELVVALKRIIAGETVVAPELAEKLALIVQNKDTDPKVGAHSIFAQLSTREMEILSHLAEGESNKVIARNLGISDGTVKLHVKSILKKLNLHSRVEAALMAVKEGVFSNSRGL